MINSMRIHGSSSSELRKVLFSSYVLLLFTWIFPFYPLFTARQQQDPNHFYYVCLKRVIFSSQWSDNFIAYVSNEKSLEDRCLTYQLSRNILTLDFYSFISPLNRTKTLTRLYIHIPNHLLSVLSTVSIASWSFL